jgi:hypothetical protein
VPSVEEIRAAARNDTDVASSIAGGATKKKDDDSDYDWDFED